MLQGASLSSGAVPLPVAYEVTVQNDSVDVRLSEESSDSAPTSPAFHGTGKCRGFGSWHCRAYVK